MKISIFNRRTLAFSHDIIMASLSYIAALYLRLGDDIISFPINSIISGVILFTITCAIIFWFSKLYRGIWAFSSIKDLSQIFKAVSASVVTFTLISFFLTRSEGVPRTLPIIVWFILMASMGGSRLLLRLIRERRLSALWEKSGGGRTNVLLFGAGDESDLFIRAVNNNPQAPFKIVGIIGENEKHVGRQVHGIEVMGTTEDLPSIIKDLRNKNLSPSRLVITRASARMHANLISHLLDQSTSLGLKLSRVPSITDLNNDISNTKMIEEKPLALEDLLGRTETVLNRDAIKSLIKNKRVLITGAGGSIGSELVRQIAELSPSHITLVEISEFNLYKIEIETKEKNPKLSIRALLGDVRDMARLTQIFQDEKPNLVFHAAAIKHVPLSEENVREAILTNVIGTRFVADCCAKANVDAMVMISTDKAVNSTNVMGATKRLAETYIQALDLISPKSRFMIVRFGNVLGSTGSVVPRFQKQIANGGPITVTHPDITRYFMTIAEAVELVLQASAFGVDPTSNQRGRVMVLDMGKPIKIVDLANQMIRLAGLRPNEDIKIIYTGLRAGEKLHEELFGQAEELIPSKADGIHLARSPKVDLPQLQQNLSKFATLLQAGMNESSAITRLEELVTDFKRK